MMKEKSLCSERGCLYGAPARRWGHRRTSDVTAFSTSQWETARRSSKISLYTNQRVVRSSLRHSYRVSQGGWGYFGCFGKDGSDICWVVGCRFSPPNFIRMPNISARTRRLIFEVRSHGWDSVVCLPIGIALACECDVVPVIEGLMAHPRQCLGTRMMDNPLGPKHLALRSH